MKKYLLNVLLLGLLSVFAISCSSDDDDTDDNTGNIKLSGIYILNTGSWGTPPILANLSYYDPETATLTKDVFTKQNKIEMGDTGQDMLIYGAKMYFSVTVSNRLYITDHAAKLLSDKAIIEPKTDGGDPMNPRSLIADGGYVYTSTQAGYVLKIDTTSLEIKNKIEVGKNPEQMTIIGQKLYVVNSVTEKTVSVIDLKTLAVSKINLSVFNLYKITKDNNGNLYVISMGDYNVTEGSNLLKIDTKNNNAITKLGSDVASGMALSKDGNKLYLLNENFTTGVNSLSYYDIASGQIKGSFVTDNTDVSKVVNISVNPNNGEIYLGVMKSYTANGSMYILSSDGKLKATISDTNGLNPAGAYFFPQK